MAVRGPAGAVLVNTVPALVGGRSGEEKIYHGVSNFIVQTCGQQDLILQEHIDHAEIFHTQDPWNDRCRIFKVLRL